MALQELEEETDIKLKSLNFIAKEAIYNDSCRRGCDHHIWHIFSGAVSDYSQINIKTNDEGTEPQWQSVNNALKTDLTVPVRLILQKYAQQLLIDN